MKSIRKYRYILILLIILPIIVFTSYIMAGKSSFTTQIDEWMHYDNFNTPTRFVKLKYHGTVLVGYTIEMSTSYQSIHLKDNEEAEKKYQSVTKAYKNKKGIETNLVFEKNVIFEKITFDFDKMNNNDFSKSKTDWLMGKLPPKGMNLEQAKKILKRENFRLMKEWNKQKEKEAEEQAKRRNRR